MTSFEVTHYIAQRRKDRLMRSERLRLIFRDLIQMPAHVRISGSGVDVQFHRRAHLPIVIASGLLEKKVAVPWWGGKTLTMTG